MTTGDTGLTTGGTYDVPLTTGGTYDGARARILTGMTGGTTAGGGTTTGGAMVVVRGVHASGIGATETGIRGVVTYAVLVRGVPTTTVLGNGRKDNDMLLARSFSTFPLQNPMLP